jgi:hypothetical protein
MLDELADVLGEQAKARQLGMDDLLDLGRRPGLRSRDRVCSLAQCVGRPDERCADSTANYSATGNLAGAWFGGRFDGLAFAVTRLTFPALLFHVYLDCSA